MLSHQHCSFGQEKSGPKRHEFRSRGAALEARSAIIVTCAPCQLHQSVVEKLPSKRDISELVNLSRTLQVFILARILDGNQACQVAHKLHQLGGLEFDSPLI